MTGRASGTAVPGGRQHALMVLLSVVLSGCTTVGPDYVVPTVEMPTAFVGAIGTGAQDAAGETWWRGYKDKTLDDLVTRALAANTDLAQARSRIAAVEAALRATGINRQLDGTLTAQSTRAGGDDVSAATTDTATLTGSYVLDLFGGIRRGQERALAERDAVIFDAAATRLAVISSLVGRYIDARYHQEALALTRATISSRERTLELVREQARAGMVSEIDVVRAQSDLASARADLPVFQEGFERNVFALATLLAEPAGPLMRQLQAGVPQPRPRGGTATGVPADLLRNRPDIRAEERRLAAAVAAVGVAEAELYPSLTLSGSVAERDGSTWSFGPSLTLPVLNRGRLSASRDQAVANAQAAELVWRGVVLDATEDVQVAASAYRTNRHRMDRLADAVVSSERLVELSRETFAQGETTLIDLLDAERSYTAARLSLAEATRQTATTWAELQVAIGRGAKEPS
ncbi:efflux transporter outer membrane subunit [Tabrizicola piscis]|uniref:Efflux transporter outer membrane subunit n=1 Tax=Tabrizicola piscis TaxID=2494374 RepID=A0A3S8U7E1_9RHOB|nr:efflux transporter outer membrane subunit [Tabrizicola piscis]AZL59521.1 efflux transporter outer membrane subunit [Tabrizicola piscis]